MRFIHDKTDLMLHDFLEEIEPRPQTWRVISIEFHVSDTVESPIFQNLCRSKIQDIFKETDAHIFWHKPAFILIFFKGRVLPIEKKVETLLKEIEFKGVKRFYDILDLSIDWQNLLKLMDQVTLPFATSAIPKGVAINSRNQNGLLDDFKISLSEDRINYLKPSRLSRNRPVILLIEDDLMILQMVKSVVEEYFDVVFAETVRQAIIYYQRHLPDMVFLDIHLPDGNGMELLQDIADADAESHVVMLSAQTKKEKILEALEIGAKNYIPKPFTRRILMDVIHTFLDQKTALSKQNLLQTGN